MKHKYTTLLLVAMPLLHSGSTFAEESHEEEVYAAAKAQSKQGSSVKKWGKVLLGTGGLAVLGFVAYKNKDKFLTKGKGNGNSTTDDTASKSDMI